VPEGNVHELRIELKAVTKRNQILLRYDFNMEAMLQPVTLPRPGILRFRWAQIVWDDEDRLNTFISATPFCKVDGCLFFHFLQILLW